MSELLCRMCAVPERMSKTDVLSEVVQQRDSLHKKTPVSLESNSTGTVFQCPECGGYAGYAVTENHEVVAASDLPSERFHR